MRRQFNLPSDDEAYLNTLNLEWETVVEGGNWLIIHGYPIPDGYNHSKADIAINISAGYPDTKLDMVYVYPPLLLRNGSGIGALSPHGLDGKTYQRWSRHRTPQNPWRPGVDDLSGHLILVDHWFERESRKVSA